MKFGSGSDIIVEEDILESIETEAGVEDEIHDSIKAAINAIEDIIDVFDESDYVAERTHVDTKQKASKKKPST